MGNKREAEKRSAEEAAWELLSKDVMMWGKLFFPHHFVKRTPMFHEELLRAAMVEQFLSVASPRRSAKSTVLSFLYPFHKIVFKIEPFIVLISNTFKKASMYLDTIKMELRDNANFKQAFTAISFERDAEGDTIFKHKDGFQTLFLCKGVDQLGSLRGVKFGPHRPGLVIIDDMEDDILVKSPERRAQLREDFDAVLGQVGHEKTQHIIVGTILHDDSQLAKTLHPDMYKKFRKIIYRAHIEPDTPNERSLWPEQWTVAYLKQIRAEEPNVYAKELQNDPVAGSNTRFKKEDFRYWHLENGKAILEDETQSVSYDLFECRAAIACDLAWKERRDADSTVLMPGFITPNSEILIDSYISKKGMRPDELEEQLFLMAERLEKLTGSTVPIGFEKAMLENVTQWLLKQAMKKRNKFLYTKELMWDADKNTRIETRLQPRYSQHVIFHKHGMGDLEHQLERFPSGTHDDLADCAQGLVQLLQFPKERVKPSAKMDSFEWWRKQILKAHHKETKKSGKNVNRWTTIPAREAWR